MIINKARGQLKVGHVNNVHALPMENLFNNIECTIFRQHAYYLGKSNELISLNMAWIFLGMLGSNSDFYPPQISLLVGNTLYGLHDDLQFEMDPQRYFEYNLLAHCIYPKWRIFVQSIKKALKKLCKQLYDDA